MRIHVLTSLAVQLRFVLIVQSCLFKIVNNNDSKTSQKKQNGMTQYVRKIYPNTTSGNPADKCVCGKVGQYLLEEWDLFVYIRERNDSDKFLRTCMGSIIAHNLVVTSHKCLMTNGKPIRPYDAWLPSPKHKETNMASAKDVMIGTLSQTLFAPEKIICNPEYSVYAVATDAASGHDIAIMVMEDDLFQLLRRTDGNGNPYKEHAFLPVCLPLNDGTHDLSKSVQHRYGYVKSFGGEYFYPDGKKLEARSVNELVIFDGKECDEEQSFGDFSTSGSLCIRTVAPFPSLRGTALLINGNDGIELAKPHPDQTAFLAGLATETQKRPPGKHINYAYFGNVFKNLDYIEKVAQEQGSMWCDTPPYVPVKEDNLKLDEWPWELGKDNKLRSETLDCACGFKNSDKTGRIAGGEDAIPYEFGWMVKFFGSFIPDDKDVSYGHSCGAAIINDRVILTAAHCVVEKGDKRNPNGVPYELVKETQVVIGSHTYRDQKNDTLVKVKQIIVHPGYVPSLKNGVFSFDMALIILKEPLNFSKATTLKDVKDNDIRPICLPKVDQKIELTNGTELTAMGWGLLDPWEDKPSVPSVLQKLQVPVRDLKYCTENVRGVVPSTVFCVGNYTKKFGVATGDSGGPLVYRKPNGQYFQVGAVSYGIDYVDETEWLDFIADVQQFVPFIEYYSKLNEGKWCKI